MNHTLIRSLALGGLCALAFPAMAGTWTMAAGADYSAGKYGYTSTTDILSMPVSVGYESGPWRFKLTVPYIRITGEGNVIPGLGQVNNSNPVGRGRSPLAGGGSTSTSSGTSTRGTASGLGDIVAKASYELFYDRDSRFGLDVSGKVKFGTADEAKGLGTGKNDYTLGVDAYKGIGDWTLFGGVGYTIYGSSTYIPLDNGAETNVGAGYRISTSDNVGAYYYYRERIAPGGYPRSEVTGYWNHHFSKALELQAYALTGLANGSPDWGGGAVLKWRF
jgi:hypothetical protein